MQKLTFTNARGVSIDLTSTPFGITDWEGFSNVDMEVQSQSVPFVDGSVYIDNLLDNRELSVTLAIEDNNNLSRRYELRREVIKVLNPKLGEGILTYTNNYLSKRIRCVPHTPIFKNHNSDSSGTPKASLSFTACEPYWEDIESSLVNFSLTEQPTVVNEGDVATQVKLRLSGQCTNPRITNVTTGAQIGLTGLITEPVDIVTEFGKKSVTGSAMGWTNIFGGYLYGIANKGESTVVVGTDGAVLYSKDGISWKSQMSGTVKNLYGIASNFNFNLFVACGLDGTIIYSEDGKEWSAGTSTSASDLKSIACSNTKFIAVGEGGVIEQSSDGMTFSAVASPVSVDLESVIYDGTSFIAVGRNGTMISSTDGTAWTVIDCGTENSLYGIGLDTNTGVYLAVGAEGTIVKSTDLETWETLTPPTYTKFNSVAYNSYLGEFFIAGDSGAVVTGMEEWTVQETGLTVNLMCASFVKELGLNFICGQGLLLRSANESDWEKCISITDTQLHDVLYDNALGLYIASGANGNLAISSNSEIWQSRNINIDVNLFALAQNPDTGAIIGVGTGGTIVRSYDGETWQKVLDGVEPYTYYLKVDETGYLLLDTEGSRLIIATSADAGSLYGICYNSSLGKFFAVGDAGRIVSSVDGSIWNEEVSNVNSTLRDITVNNGLMVAVGDEGTIIKSADGTYWEQVPVTFTFNIKGITESPTKTRFVAVGEGGYIITSKDGDRWRMFRTSNHITLNAVCYSPVYSQFLAVGNDGTIATSVDGQSWSLSSSGTNQNYESVIFIVALGKYISAGSRGTIMSSYLSASENLINALSPNSDINFNLDVGDNILRVSCESGDPRVTIEFKNKYVGV